jgi:ribonuclease P protein component
VLPAAARIRSHQEFAAVMRTGRRAGSRTVVVHALGPDAGATDAATRIGFVVGRAVGGAVARNQVRRRLRHLMRDRLSTLPASSRFVVRALAPAVDVSYRTLGTDVDRCLAYVTGPAR